MAENNNPSKLTKKRKTVSSGSTGISNENPKKETENEAWNHVRQFYKNILDDKTKEIERYKGRCKSAENFKEQNEKLCKTIREKDDEIQRLLELVEQKDLAVTEKLEAVSRSEALQRELDKYKKMYDDQQAENQKCVIELNNRESELNHIYNFMAPNIKNFLNRQRLTPQQSIPGSYHSNPQGQHLQRHPLPPPTGAVPPQRQPPPPPQPGTVPPQRQSFPPQTGDMQRPQQPSISLQQVTSTV